ncbi:MAG: SgcJ/EcaC family oxidoreductase [Paludisphaera borealis]|uniref:YybH family protein n=1 Tax=Paludisphaera borealis TaxID=1387353 RepID=UPI002850A5CD|nr:SgcJ/EcaC family oxidoreductase [Paludisphaera borealis]MDR3621237.1 SgcJ/EcaC family oxidoreductase [Paludisphaera borealis]
MSSFRLARSFVVGLALAGLIAGGSSSVQGAPATDDEAVREVVQKYVDAREAKDPKAIEGLFTADADQLVSDGTWRRGRDALVRGMLESSRKNPAKRTIAVESIRFLAPDVALADGRYQQAGRTEAETRAMWTTITLKRTADGWKIAAIRNMLPAMATPAKK